MSELRDQNISTGEIGVSHSNSTILDHYTVIFNIKRGMQEGKNRIFIMFLGKKSISINLLQTLVLLESWSSD